MQQELDAAADWWIERIRTWEMRRIGDPELSALLSITQPSDAQRNAITEDQIATFRTTLIQAAIEKFTPYWNPDEPMKGGYYRILDVDYAPGKGTPLFLACEASGINTRALPEKTIMWVDPGKVSVRHGYHADVIVIYPAFPPSDDGFQGILDTNRSLLANHYRARFPFRKETS